MVGEIYDYMLGLVIVGIIFIAAIFTIPNLSMVNLKQVDQQQLRNTALNLFNAMLLGEGSPPDWASPYPFDQNQRSTFGLSLAESGSIYTLDADKLQRLYDVGPGQIDYEKVRELLNLQDYGFRLTVYRPFSVDYNITINDEIADPLITYSAKIARNMDRRPVQNAEVTVTLLCLAKNPDKVDEPIVKVTGPKDVLTKQYIIYSFLRYT